MCNSGLGLVASPGEQLRYTSRCFQSPIPGLCLLWFIFHHDLVTTGFVYLTRGAYGWGVCADTETTVDSPCDR